VLAAPVGAARTGGVMKNNVRIAVALAVAVALFFVVKHFFPINAGVR
jgi:hypothetical protein